MKYLLTISFLLSFVTFSQSDSIKAKVDTSLIYDVVAEFPGNFIWKNFEYTDSASFYQENQKIWVEFIINEDGTLSDIKILRGQKFTGIEMLRVISIMPNWKPAELNGVKVKVKYTLPMNICLG
jgi:hypothetical protein